MTDDPCDRLGETLRELFTSEDADPYSLGTANVVDGLCAIARAITRLADILAIAHDVNPSR